MLVSNYLSPEQDIFLHSENGILGVGPRAKPGEEDLDLISAGKGHCTLALGASLFDQPLSFTMMRGGHLTHAVLGGIEVADNGDFANWRVPGEAVPGVGGAMDLAVGVPHVFVAMSHVTNKGKPKIVKSLQRAAHGAPLRRAHLYRHGGDRGDAERAGAARGGPRLRPGRRPGQDRRPAEGRAGLPNMDVPESPTACGCATDERGTAGARREGIGDPSDDEVHEDTTVGLIEVMKTFNAVRAGVSGIVTEICVNDSGFVDTGMPGSGRPMADTVAFVDVTLRDGHQSLWAERMTTGMMLPVAERMDRAGFDALEVLSPSISANACATCARIRSSASACWRSASTARRCG